MVFDYNIILSIEKCMYIHKGKWKRAHDKIKAVDLKVANVSQGNVKKLT